MSAVMPAQQDFDDDAWDDLLNYIEERRVIPIIGPDLLRVQTDRGLRPLYEWLAEKLAVRLQVNTAGLPQPVCGRSNSNRHQRCASSRRSPTSISS